MVAVYYCPDYYSYFVWEASMSGNNSTQTLYSMATLLVCSPCYSIGNLAGVFVSLVKDRRLSTKSDPLGMPWGIASGANALAAQLGLLAEETSLAFVSKVVIPWLAASLVVDGFLSREPF